MPEENNNVPVTPEQVNEVLQDTDLNSMFQNSEFEKEGTDTPIVQNPDGVSNTDKEEGTAPIEMQETPNDSEVPKPPTRAEGESAYQYNLRVQMFHDNQALKDPNTTEEEKSILRDHIKELRTGLGKDSGKSDQPNNKENQTTPDEPIFTEEETTAVAEFLKTQGFLTKEELAQERKQMRDEILNELKVRNVVEDHGKAIKDFYATRKDIAVDPDKKVMLENYVIENYKVDETTSGEKLAMYMDMAANYIFPKQSNQVSRESKSDVLDVSGQQGAGAQETKKGLPDDLNKKLANSGVNMKGFLY